ncbi:MAG: DUF4244 domain-containing protein [Nocardioidaceae bacterium]|jgi:hypothetical protein|nr:DUF4244 domain-containing protein [Nocardioidaceae bacterium]
MHILSTRISLRAPRRDERGMTTSEYAVGTVGACGVGGVLYELASSGWFQDLFKDVIGNLVGLLPF